MKFLKHGIKHNGKYIRVRYSNGPLIGYPEGTLTIYAKGYLDRLPAELCPKNDSDSMTDYFEKDCARILPSNPFYKTILKIILA